MSGSIYPNLTNIPMANDRDNKQIPVKGDLVKFHNGMVGEVIRIKGSGWHSQVEVDVRGTRAYRKVCDITVVGVLDRIVNALNKDDDG